MDAYDLDDLDTLAEVSWRMRVSDGGYRRLALPGLDALELMLEAPSGASGLEAL